MNRPKALNALSKEVFRELTDAINQADQCSETKVTVLTGSDKAFAAGADLKAMANLTFPETYTTNFLNHWELGYGMHKKPIIAAINGFARTS